MPAGSPVAFTKKGPIERDPVVDDDIVGPAEASTGELGPQEEIGLIAPEGHPLVETTDVLPHLPPIPAGATPRRCIPTDHGKPRTRWGDPLDPNRPVCLIDELHPTPDQIVGGQHGSQLGHSDRPRHVIGVNVQHELATSRTDPRISGPVHSTARLDHSTDPGVLAGEPLDDVAGPVGRTVVDHHDLVVGAKLGEHRGQDRTDRRGFVPRRDHHRNGRTIHDDTVGRRYPATSASWVRCTQVHHSRPDRLQHAVPSPRMPELVTVYIAAFDAERYIGDAIRSCLHQTHEDLEIIVVDDASSDSTAEVVRALNDDRVRLVRSPVNLGPGPARNLALDRARGGYVTPMDADDIMHPARVELLLALALQHPGTIVADRKTTLQDGDDLQQAVATLRTGCGTRPARTSNRLPLAEYAATNPFARPLVPRVLLDRRAVRYPDARRGEDVAFLIRAIAASDHPALVLADAGTYGYRRRPGSLSTKTEDRLEDLIALYEELADELIDDTQVHNAVLRQLHAARDDLQVFRTRAHLRSRQPLRAVDALRTHGTWRRLPTRSVDYLRYSPDGWAAAARRTVSGRRGTGAPTSR